MKHLTYLLFSIFLLFGCKEEVVQKPFTQVEIETIYEDSIRVRAIEIMGSSLAFAANKGVFGSIDLSTNKVRLNVMEFQEKELHFRSVAHTNTDFFMLSIESPALLYKTGDSGKMELVYKEEGDGVFYDAITFWNDKEGIAVGDSVDGCLSIIITRDGGMTWSKLSCENLPQGIEGEGAFAASNSNIAIHGKKTWIATTSGRIYYSKDKGVSWEIQETPIIATETTQGIYSLDFLNEKQGIAFGGDYTKPEQNIANKAITDDGGKTWKLLANGQEPGYKSCVQFVPNSNGNEIVAIGFTGISYSNDRGESWKQLSEEAFYTLRFANDTTAYAAGKNRISKLNFKK